MTWLSQTHFSDNVISIHDLTVYNLPLLCTITQTKGATAFDLDLKVFSLEQLNQKVVPSLPHCSFFLFLFSYYCFFVSLSLFTAVIHAFSSVMWHSLGTLWWRYALLWLWNVNFSFTIGKPESSTLCGKTWHSQMSHEHLPGAWRPLLWPSSMTTGLSRWVREPTHI